MEFYQQLAWPQIPKELLDQISFSGRNSYILDYGRRYYRGQQEIHAPLWTAMDTESTALQAWLKENITLPPTATTVQQILCQSTHPTHCEMIPHTDVIRSYAINYFIETGGQNSETTWYQEKDQPILRTVRPEFNNQQIAEGWVGYDDLTEIAHLQAQPHTWYWFRTDVIHGVKNLTGTRKYISISE